MEKRMKIKTTAIILGLALFVVGLVGKPLVSGQVTVVIDIVPPTIQGTFPAGSQSSPSSIKVSTTYKVSITSNESGLTCWVMIGGNRLDLIGQLQEPIAGVDYDLILQQNGNYRWMCSSYCGQVSSDYTTYDAAKQGGITHIKTYHPDKLPTIYGVNWLSPAASGITTEFKFYAQDTAGNQSTVTTYGLTGTPSGDFYINGQGPLTQTSVLTVNTRTLNFELRPTALPEQITGARVEVVSPPTTITLSKQPSGYWTGSWTAPADGTYALNGYITYSGGQVLAMSITLGTPEPPQPPSNWADYLPYLTWVGLGLVVFGVVMPSSPSLQSSEIKFKRR